MGSIWVAANIPVKVIITGFCPSGDKSIMSYFRVGSPNSFSPLIIKAITIS